MYKTLLVLALSFSPFSAFAADFKVVGMGGSDQVFIWKNKAAQSEAMSLISANVHKTYPTLVMRLLSCMVKSGTGVIVTDMGFATHDIMVVDGENAGCRKHSYRGPKIKLMANSY